MIPDFLVRLVAPMLLWLLRVVWRLNRLERVDLLPLGATLADAVELFEEHSEMRPDDDVPDAATYFFNVSPWHDAYVTIWRGTVHAVSYHSTHPSKDRDLVAAGRFYGKDVRWDEVNSGYMYRRKDGYCVMYCSAAPVIGVETSEFVQARGAAKR